MASLKKHLNSIIYFCEDLSCPFTQSKPRTKGFSILLLTSLLAFLFFSAFHTSSKVLCSPSSPSSKKAYSPASTGDQLVFSNPLLLPSCGTDSCSSSSSSSIFLALERRKATTHKIIPEKNVENVIEEVTSCDIFDGYWVLDDDDDDSEPLYKPASCPFLDDAFNCFKNGRPDLGHLKLRWKPYDCHIPRFDGLKMLRLLRGKRVVFVGDSLNRNMWESLVCALWQSLADKSRVFEASGHREFRTQGVYSFRFKDYKCSIDFIRSPFLVQEWKYSDKSGKRRETLRLDMIQGFSAKYQNADIIVFNTGHWWTHQKTYKGCNYFQEGNHVYDRLGVSNAYTKALKTWANWVDANINSSHTKVFFGGYSASHFRGQWNSGGSCDGETEPIKNDTLLPPYPWMTSILETVLAEMKTPVFYLNITKMTSYRKDGHPSIFRLPEARRSSKMMMIQDCSHWCLPGIPDTWNELLYAILLTSHQNFLSSSL